MSDLYERDFYAWTEQQAGLLRTGRLAEADLDNIAEEIESMGRSKKRELVSRLTVLLLHLLKWQFQPTFAGLSWRATIQVQRRDLEAHLEDNASLRPFLPKAIERAYGNALIRAVAETGLADATFPAACPWRVEQALDHAFWPG